MKDFYDKLIIEEEKNDKDKNSFIIKYNYEIDSFKKKQGGLSFGYLFGKLSSHNFYISASKLLFDLESNNVLFYQNSLKNKDEQSLIFNYKIYENKNSSSNKNKEDIKFKSSSIYIFNRSKWFNACFTKKSDF